MKSIASLMLLVVGLVCGQTLASEPELPIRAFAKIIGPTPAADVDPNTPMSAMRRVAAATLPDVRFPQYRLAYGQRDPLNQSKRDRGAVDLELAIGERRLRIEATMTIDGKPFTALRTERTMQLQESAVSEQDADSTIARYHEAIGEDVSVDEARWLLANWIDGPELLILNDHFQKFRSVDRPIFDVLDRDINGVVSQAEIDGAVESLWLCDSNRDEVVDVLEIQAAANDPRRSVLSSEMPDTGTLLSVVHEPKKDVDIELLIQFRSDEPKNSTIEVVKIAKSLSVSVGSELIDDRIDLRVDGHPLILSAVQRSSRGAQANDQVSIGAIVDGYPMLPFVDPNNDGRFTIRELRELTERVRHFDGNDDGTLTLDEMSSPVRLCFGLGPTVDLELAGLRHAPREPTENEVNPPEWFTRMDRNADRDLSRGEFPGSADQFNALDADKDDLISAGEAMVDTQELPSSREDERL